MNTVTDTLSSLSPAPKDVYVSIVSQTVTFRRPDGLSIDDVKNALELAGFDVAEDDPRARSTLLPPLRKRQKHEAQCKVCQDELRASLDSDEKHHLEHAPPNLASATTRTHEPPEHGPFRLRMSIGGMTCASCLNTITSTLSQLDGVSDIAIDLIGNSGTVTISSHALVDKVVEAIDDCGYSPEVDDVRALRPPASAKITDPHAAQPLRVSLSIGGMTCASCSNTITDALSKLDGVSDVVVDLIGNSASLRVESKALLKIVMETIEDVGYEVRIMPAR